MSQDDPVDDEPARSRRDRRRTWFAVTGVVVLLVGGYALAVAFSGDTIARGTRVGDVSIGGLTVAQAEQRLSADLLPQTDEPITVEVDGTEHRLDPDELGLSLDVDATVDHAHGGSRIDPRVLWDSWFGGEPIAPVLDVDQDRLIDRVRALADTVDQPAVEPSVEFTAAGPVPHPARVGTTLDPPGAVVAILDAWLVETDPIELPVETAEPALDQGDLDAAVEDLARPAMSAPVRLREGARTWTVSPRAFAPALTIEAVDGELAPVVDGGVLAERVPRLLDAAGEEPRDATVRIRDDKPVVVPAHAGVRAEPADLADALAAALAADNRTARVTGKRVPPEVGTREVRSWKITEQVSSFTTYYPHEDYRNTNIGRAAELINGTVLQPGDTFSLNDTVGERTAENGFTVGYVISNGIFARDYGGGVSQVATTTYNAAFFAGMKDVEHKPHSFYIDRYPMGREATVAWPTVDLRFQNTTPYGVLIEAWIVPSTPSGRSGEMHVRMWSTKHWTIKARSSGPYAYTSPGTQIIKDDPGCVPTTGYSGFDIDTYRDFYRDGDKLRTETFHTTYIPADTVICR